MDLTTVEIKTARLKLVPINEGHILDVYKYFSIDITQYMYPQPTGDIEDTNTFIKESLIGLKNGTNLQLVILDNETDEFIGCVGLHHLERKDPELGVWVKKRAHSNGYGMEAIRGVINWAKENIEFEHLIYPVDRLNKASRRIPVSCGGKFMKSYKMLNMAKKELDIVEYWIK